MQAGSPTDLADHQHVRIVEMARTRVFFMTVLAKTNARHAAPRIPDVARRAPGIAANFRAPFPDVAHAVLAEAEQDVAVHFVERSAHDAIGLLQRSERIISVNDVT